MKIEVPDVHANNVDILFYAGKRSIDALPSNHFNGLHSTEGDPKRLMNLTLYG